MKKYISILLVLICLLGLTSCSKEEREMNLLKKIKDVNNNVVSYQASLDVSSTKNDKKQEQTYVIPITMHGTLLQNDQILSCSISFTENNQEQYGDHKHDIISNKKINGFFDNDLVLIESQTDNEKVNVKNNENKSENIYKLFLTLIEDVESTIEKTSDGYEIDVDSVALNNKFKNCNEIIIETIQEYIGEVKEENTSIKFLFDKDLYFKKVIVESLNTETEDYKYSSSFEISFSKHNEDFTIQKLNIKESNADELNKERTISNEENFLFERINVCLSKVSEYSDENVPMLVLIKEIDFNNNEDNNLIELLKTKEMTSCMPSEIGNLLEYDLDDAILTISCNSFWIDMELLLNKDTNKSFYIDDLKVGTAKKDEIVKKYSNIKSYKYADKTVIEPVLSQNQKYSMRLYINKENTLYGFELKIDTN